MMARLAAGTAFAFRAFGALARCGRAARAPRDGLGPVDIHRNHTMMDAMETKAKKATAVLS